MFIEGRRVGSCPTNSAPVSEIELNSVLFDVAKNYQPIGTECASHWLKSTHGLLRHLYDGVLSIREHPVAYGVIEISCQY
jgi:hypothetical protein